MTSPHPTIGRPAVPMKRDDDGKYTARCQHCPWSHGPDYNVVTVEQAKYHRSQHANGAIPVTVRWMVRDNKFGRPIGLRDGYADKSEARREFPSSSRYALELRHVDAEASR